MNDPKSTSDVDPQEPADAAPSFFAEVEHLEAVHNPHDTLFQEKPGHPPFAPKKAREKGKARTSTFWEKGKSQDIHLLRPRKKGKARTSTFCALGEKPGHPPFAP